MVLLLQTPYVDVSKKPEVKSGMDFSETQPSYTQDTERRQTNKNRKQKTKEKSNTNPPQKPECSFEFPLQCLFSCFVVLLNPIFHIIYLTFFLSLSIGFKNGLTFFDDSETILDITTAMYFYIPEDFHRKQNQ